MEKASKKWEDMQIRQNNWHAFKDNFAQAYRRYQIHRKTSDARGYDDSEKHAHETDAQVTTTNTLKSLGNATMEDKEWCQTSQSSTWHSPRSLPNHQSQFWCSLSICIHYRFSWTLGNQKLRNRQLTRKISQQFKDLLLESCEDPHSWLFQSNMPLPQGRTPSGGNLGEQDGRKWQVAQGR